MVANENAHGEIFNITAEAVTVNEYVQVLSEIVGKPADVVELPSDVQPEVGKPVYNHLFGKAHHGVLSIEKAERLLGYAPRFDFRSGHQQTYEWFMAQGLQDTDEPLMDPLWFASYDFEREAELAAQVRGR